MTSYSFAGERLEDRPRAEEPPARCDTGPTFVPCPFLVGRCVHTSLVGHGVHTSLVCHGVHTSLVSHGVHTSLVCKGVPFWCPSFFTDGRMQQGWAAAAAGLGGGGGTNASEHVQLLKQEINLLCERALALDAHGHIRLGDCLRQRQQRVE